MNLNARVPEKQEYRQLERKCMAMGISVKDIKVVDGKRREILVKIGRASCRERVYLQV